jgi:sec-independent protein translocase protein TatB
MPDIGWMELLVIGVVALIVVGPKDLPMMFRRLGEMTGRVRAMAKDFQRAMDQAADESGMSDLKRDIGSVSKYANPKKMGMDALKDTLDDIDPSKYAEGSETRRIAEEKAALQKKTRADIEARRKDRDAAIIAEKNAAMAPAPEPAMEPATAASAAAAIADDPAPEMTPAPDPAPGPAPARTGTADT